MFYSVKTAGSKIAEPGLRGTLRVFHSGDRAKGFIYLLKSLIGESNEL